LPGIFLWCLEPTIYRKDLNLKKKYWLIHLFPETTDFSNTNKKLYIFTLSLNFKDYPQSDQR
jgi:hypothetical protein